MNHWKPSKQYLKIVEANRQYYARNAWMYDASETHLLDRQAQQALEADLDQIVHLINKPVDQITALDACGGSGNISLKLLRRGINVTTVDLSIDLLEIYQQKCTEQNFSPSVFCAEIGAFLSTDSHLYDLITFSSALHHLENIAQILELTRACLKPGGLLFTILDPIPRQEIKPLTKLFLQLDYVIFKALGQTGDLMPSILRRIKRSIHGSTHQNRDNIGLESENIGVLAEYHVNQGIDDVKLSQDLEKLGYAIVWHDRYVVTRYALTRLLVQCLSDATSFKLLLRKL